MSLPPMTLPTIEQTLRSQPLAGARARLGAPAPWPEMRRDLLQWLIFNDLAAVALPTWFLVLSSGPSAAWPVGLVGALMITMVWVSGGLGVEAVDQGRSRTAHLILCAVIAAPAVLLLNQFMPGGTSAWTLLGWLTLQSALMLIGRNVEETWLHRRRMDGHALRRTLIVMGPGAEPLLQQLRRHPADGFLIVGYVSSGNMGSPHKADPVRGTRHIAQLVRAERIDVVMTVGAVAPADLITLMRGLEGSRARLVVAPGLQDVEPNRMRGLPVTHGWTGLIAVRTRRTREIGKMILDRVVGALLLAIALPVLAVAALAIRLESPGSPFYKQTRVGLGGKHFTMWKLRSMYIDADARRAALVAKGGDAGNKVLFKDSADPRITRVGRLLRRTSLDELPQLINVVTGEMSLVGPRPALPQEVAQYDAEARRRLLVRPGMTGLWQVSGRSDLSWESTVALDRHYVDNRSGSLDASILAATLRAVVGGKGAY